MEVAEEVSVFREVFDSFVGEVVSVGVDGVCCRMEAGAEVLPHFSRVIEEDLEFTGFALKDGAGR